jgi:hypothetical protein
MEMAAVKVVEMTAHPITTATRITFRPCRRLVGCHLHQEWQASATACHLRRQACLALATDFRLHLLHIMAEVEETPMEEDTTAAAAADSSGAIILRLPVVADIRAEETSMAEIVDRTTVVAGTELDADRWSGSRVTIVGVELRQSQLLD